jgi:GNAT superfamily N-acetyltransferase
MIKIVVGKPAEIQRLRNEVLWPHKTFENCLIEEDFLSTTFHIVAKNENDEVVGTSTWMVQDSPRLTAHPQYRLRAMAVASEARRLGIGKQLVEFGLAQCRERGAAVVWCDARQVALDFYRSLEFSEFEDEYEIPIIGTHRFMFYFL